MGYQLESALWRGVFAVPGAVVDEHLKLCDETALKVLLLILRRGDEVTLEEISNFLGTDPQAVEQAISYWTKLGILMEPTPAPPQRPNTKAPPPIVDPAPTTQPTYMLPGKERRKLTTRQINEMSAGDDTIAFLLREAQMIIGKPLTPVATDTVAALYSYYGMNPEVLLMLLQYCVGQKRDNMRYIEKVAASWIEMGIDTHEKAEREILAVAERAGQEAAVRRVLGINDRALISSEREYIAAWSEQGIPSELIGLAYERTIEQKGKLSLPYINGILQNWRAKGISTPAGALQEMRAGKKNSAEAANPSSLDEMEQIYKYGDV
ncbi:MAG: DnaD domain protein [Oscillospiraceae bacterium]|nr:DnaD domain protein [Oscillospiraceae bacterium]